MTTVNNFISLVFKCMDLYVTLVYHNFMVTSTFDSGFLIFFLCDVIRRNRQHVLIY